MPGEIPSNDQDKAVSIRNQVSQLKDKIQAKEGEVGRLFTYSVGKNDREIIILSQPIMQQTEIDWNDKTRLVNRDRYIVVGSFGIGAIDFVKQVRFDATDNQPDEDQKFMGIKKGIKYAPEGQWEDIIGQSNQEDNGRNENGFLRNIRTLNGVDKRTPTRSITDSVEVVMHDTDGLILTPDGTPGIIIGHDFASSISQNVDQDQFKEALKLSIESAKPVEMKTDTSKQEALIHSVIQLF